MISNTSKPYSAISKICMKIPRAKNSPKNPLREKRKTFTFEDLFNYINILQDLLESRVNLEQG